MTNYDVVKKLLGEIKPIGDTGVDERRSGNLSETIDVVSALLRDISNVSEYRNRKEYSMKKAGERAHNFLKDLSEIC